MTTRQFNAFATWRPSWLAAQMGRAAHAAAQLRHHLLGKRIDIRVIQVLLGHAKLDTTGRYTQVATNIIREVMSPLRPAHAAVQRGRRPHLHARRSRDREAPSMRHQATKSASAS